MVKLFNLLGVATVMLAVVSLSFMEAPDVAVVQAKRGEQKKNKNIHTYHTTYFPAKHEEIGDLVEHSDTYDPRTKTRKVVNRKKVLRKVKKIKTNSTINT